MAAATATQRVQPRMVAGFGLVSRICCRIFAGETGGDVLAGYGRLQAGFETGALFVVPEIYDLLWVSSFWHGLLQSEMPGPDLIIPAHKIILKNLKG